MNFPHRRQFLKSASGAALAIGATGGAPQCFLRAAHSASADRDRVLVIVELSGGNDGLNTVVPYAHDQYRSARPNLAIPEPELIKLDDEYGLHPSLRGMKDLLDDGSFCIVQGVGYDRPNRSHFESMDIWHSCLRKDESRDDGWVGRLLESLNRKRDDAQGGDVPAIHLGKQTQPFALASREIRVPTVKDLKEFQLLGDDRETLRKLLESGPVVSPPNDETADDLLGFLQTSTRGALAASRRVNQAADAYRSDTSYPDSALGEQMKVVAQLIDSGMNTRVYYLQVDGFDTHARQRETHAILLRQWSEAVAAFVKDVDAHGHGDRVCVMTFSEFGRRVAENASDGTDHGAAGPMFLCGSGVKAGRAGKVPDLSRLVQGDLKHEVDFRRVYATVLNDWMGVDPDPILHGRYETLPLFG